MKTNTQKNFKKEMERHKKEVSKKSSAGFYSYIEDDFIDSYYSQRKKRRRKIVKVSFISLAIFLFNLYALYTWLDPIIYRTTGTRIPRIERLIFNDNNSNRTIDPKSTIVSSNPNHIIIRDYLVEMNKIVLDNNSMINYAYDNFQEASESESIKRDYLKTLDSYREDIDILIYYLQKISPPYEFMEYHQIYIKFYKDVDKILTVYIENINNNSRDFGRMSAIYEDSHLKSNELRQLYVEGLEYAGIKYEIIKDDGDNWNIRYYIDGN